MHSYTRFKTRNGILLPLHNTHLVPLETVANSNVEHLDINIFLRTIGQPFIFVCQHTNTTSFVNTSKNSFYSKGTANHIVMVYDNKQNKTKQITISTKTETRTGCIAANSLASRSITARYSLLSVLTYVCHSS